MLAPMLVNAEAPVHAGVVLKAGVMVVVVVARDG
jgi:hypothetical protein